MRGRMGGRLSVPLTNLVELSTMKPVYRENGIVKNFSFTLYTPDNIAVIYHHYIILAWTL